MAMVSLVLMNFPASAVDPVETANQVVGAESSLKATKEVLNLGLQVARSKPAMTVATGIVCISCVPVAGAGLCIACGILIAKTFG